MMPNYSNSGFYKDSKNAAKAKMNAAKNTDKMATYKESLSVGTLVGNMFSPLLSVAPAIGGVLGLGVGAVLNYTGNGYKTEQDKVNQELIAYRNQLYGEAGNAMDERNKNLSSLKRAGNTLKGQFDYNYGTGLFDELQRAIGQILEMSDGKTIHGTLSKLREDTVVGELANRLVYNDSSVFSDTSAFTTDEYKKILEEYVSIESLGSEYARYIIETAQQGGAIRHEFDALSDELMRQEEKYIKDTADLGTEYSNMFNKAFFGQISDELDSALGIGASEAQSSGFKKKGASASTKLAKVKADIARVAYVTTLDYYSTKLKSEIDNNNMAMSKAYYSYQKQVISMQNKIQTSIDKSINDYLGDIGTGLKAAEKLEEEEASKTAAALAYNSVIGSYSSGDRKTYDVESITGR